ncbi:MAG TPA: hypothetical protein VF898_08640, partial [Chloroflexota bacterium]
MSNDQSSVSAQLLIYSGRPDPAFDLAQSEIDSLSSAIQQTIGQQQTDEAPEGGLGYRGFLVTNTGSASGMPAEFEVYQGTLTSGGQTWRDTAGVES